ncbi:unnamed protein product [Arctia plantaginis]|uniref:Uncharacterized protein n=1 Tax=Arctia plantaginis TaxID=874455 RepID=A0A8S0YX22_ARCPL|nr:unnamed protein product [Arctia plantaginis]
MTSKDIEEAEQMRCALSAIADEVQKFQNESLSSNEANDKILHNEKMFSAALVQCKSTLKLKQEQIRFLRQHLKTACVYAKTLSVAKERETASLNNQLNNTRSEYWDLVKQEKDKNKLIHDLQAENETIRSNLRYLNNFIQLGYRGLQNIAKDKLEDFSTLKQLQKIIFFCGQYYADYCNESEKCRQLEQKNRFLNSKLRILESHLEIAMNDQRYSNGNGKCMDMPMKQLPISKQCCNSVCAVSSESQIGHRCCINMREIRLNRQILVNNKKKIDLTSHLSTVKKLLHDQDTLLKDLKSLSNQINVEL